MKPYSKDLRLRVLAAVDDGTPREEVTRTFSVSVPTIKRWLKRRRETGDVEPKPIPGRPPLKGAVLKEWLPSHLEANPDLTLEEHRESFEEARGVAASISTVGRAIARLPGGWPLKKVEGSLRARRGGEDHLPRTVRNDRPQALRLRGRVRDAHLHDALARQGSEGPKGVRQGATQPRQEHDADRVDDARGGDGPRDGGRGCDRSPRLRGVRRAIPGAHAL